MKSFTRKLDTRNRSSTTKSEAAAQGGGSLQANIAECASLLGEHVIDFILACQELIDEAGKGYIKKNFFTSKKIFFFFFPLSSKQPNTKELTKHVEKILDSLRHSLDLCRNWMVKPSPSMVNTATSVNVSSGNNNSNSSSNYNTVSGSSLMGNSGSSMFLAKSMTMAVKK